MSFSPNYDTYATSYDFLDGSPVANYLGIDRMREKAAAYVSGDVTEFGVGTGLESLYYDWGKLKSFVGVDNSSGMLSIARHRLDQSIEVARNGVPINLIQTYAESTPLQSSKFDTVVDTFSMCVYDHPRLVLKEMNRVVKPGGKIVLLENSRSTFAPLGWIQDVTEPLITPASKGCKWNVDVPRLADEAGWEIITRADIQLGTISLGVYRKH